MQGTEGKESDRLEADIECLSPETLHATLISSAGNHCQVWRTNKRRDPSSDGSSYTEFVIKHPSISYDGMEIKLLAKQYRLLKEKLDDIIPDALFMTTRINGEHNVCVLAQAVNIWFNLANPQNEEESVALLSKNAKPRIQLRRFLDAAREFLESDNPRLIDLYGLDNLVFDKNREIRYIDSFDVFFFEDMQELLDKADPGLERKIRRSRECLNYLNRILRLVEK